LAATHDVSILFNDGWWPTAPGGGRGRFVGPPRPGHYSGAVAALVHASRPISASPVQPSSGAELLPASPRPGAEVLDATPRPAAPASRPWIGGSRPSEGAWDGVLFGGRE